MSCPELAPTHGHLLSVCELRQCDLLTFSGIIVDLSVYCLQLFRKLFPRLFAM